MSILDMRAATLKLEEMGRWYTGTVIAEPEESQRSEYVKGGGGLPLYWVNKKPTAGASHDPRTGLPNEPVMQTEILVDTGEPDDSGSTERTLYIDNKRKIAALRAAWRAAGMPRGASMVGCKIAARWSGTEQGEGAQEAKLYEYRIQPPADGVKMRQQPAPATPAAVAPVSAPAAPASSPAPTNADTMRTAAAAPAGIDSAQWERMTQDQRNQILTALGAAAPAAAKSPSRFDDEPPF